MTFFRVGPAGIPGSIKTDMNNVLNKKFGTTGQDYPPADWPADVNLMGPLPVKSASGAIASFADGADGVPVKSCVVSFVASGGGGTPQNPISVQGVSGLEVNQAKNLLLPNPSDSSASVQNGITRSYSIATQEFTLSGTNEKTDSAWLIANWSNETLVGMKAGATYTFSHNLSNNCYGQITYYKKDGTTGTLVSLSGNANKDASTTFVVPSDYDRPRNFQLGVYRTATTVDEQAHFMINGGSTAFAFSKYQTPVVVTDTFGQTLYGGTRDLTTDKASATWGYIASYNGETLTGRWVSSMDTYIAGTAPTTGAEVAYELATPTELTGLTPHEIDTLYGDNNIYADTGTTSVEYRADIDLALNA